VQMERHRTFLAYESARRADAAIGNGKKYAASGDWRSRAICSRRPLLRPMCRIKNIVAAEAVSEVFGSLNW
jgi:hypothetical protein